MRKILQNTTQKISPKNSLSLARNRQKAEMISFSYDVNDHVYSIQNLSNFVRNWPILKLYGFCH